MSHGIARGGGTKEETRKTQAGLSSATYHSGEKPLNPLGASVFSSIKLGCFLVMLPYMFMRNKSVIYAPLVVLFLVLGKCELVLHTLVAHRNLLHCCIPTILHTLRVENLQYLVVSVYFLKLTISRKS